MPTVEEELVQYAKSLLLQLANPSLPLDERAALNKVYDEIEDDAFAAALHQFRAATEKFLNLTARLEKAIEGLQAGPSGAITAALQGLGKLHRLVHDDEGMRTTWQSNEEFEEVFDDESNVAPTKDTLPGMPDAGGVVLVTPNPINSKEFAPLSDEYLRFFAGAQFKTSAGAKEAERYAQAAMQNRRCYEDVGVPLGIPWWFIAGIHLLESGFNFTTHLHNGDSLQARTHRVPQGRPANGSPPFTWEESARDALKGEKLAGLKDWSLARALYRWEAYNGFGYRSRGVPTPYLWSFTTIYGKGKFVGDGVFSATAVSKQCGAAAFLRALAKLNQAEIKVEGVKEDKGSEQTESSSADADTVADGSKPNIDGVVSSNIDFKSFFAERLPDVTHFEWHEFMVKGGAHQANGKNTDPPRALWPNIVVVARVLQKLREEIGKPVILTSVYRGPEYNASIGGAKRSQHMEFRAADFKVVGAGGPADWAKILKQYRNEGVFSGGIGVYNTFVHVDSRGYTADW